MITAQPWLHDDFRTDQKTLLLNDWPFEIQHEQLTQSIARAGPELLLH
jgi:hypothetical protein